ncbi:nucleotide sugar dehydrogenase [Saccharomonospora sp. NPDC046836]|uniref:nucleotide sugar dehydrogenase n=1 Tax=Saccharomonospora sp. NPDC046836 TaxID=3156921 RepID=UPI003409FC77
MTTTGDDISAAELIAAVGHGLATLEPRGDRLRPAAEPAISSVAIVGMGYVGLPTALGLHAAGLDVLGIDHNPGRLATISARAADLTEQDHQLLGQALCDARFRLTTEVADAAKADTVIVCVPTPLDAHLTPDLAPLRAACAALVEHVRPGQTLILTSTSFVGTTEELLVQPLRERGFELGSDVFVAFSPERIDPGNAEHTQAATPRVVGGVTDACAERAERVLGQLTPMLHRVSSAEVAELTKLYENSFRAVNIALANEFAEICGTLRLDPMEVTRAAATKPYGFMPFYPGPGVGGHCIPCDPHYLLWQLRRERGAAPLISEAMELIAHRPQRVVERAIEVLAGAGRGIPNARILVVGVAYKPGVQDLRESSALEIIDGLLKRGAQVDYHDPLVGTVRLPGDRALTSVSHPIGEDFDLCIVHTVHPGHDYDWVSGCALVLDATYRFDSAPGRVFV